DLAFVSGDESPAWSGLKFFGEGVESFGCVDGWIDTDRDQLQRQSAFGGVLLHFAEGCGEWRATGSAGGEDEVNGDGFAFDEIVVEIELVAVLIVDVNVGNLCGGEQFRVGGDFVVIWRSSRRSRTRTRFWFDGSQFHAALRTAPGLRRGDIRVHRTRVDDLLRNRLRPRTPRL